MAAAAGVVPVNTMSIMMPPDTHLKTKMIVGHMPLCTTLEQTRGPPVHNLSANIGHPLKLVPPHQRPSPSLMSDYASKQEVLERLLFLVAKGAIG
jgi:hypothetical protein